MKKIIIVILILISFTSYSQVGTKYPITVSGGGGSGGITKSTTNGYGILVDSTSSLYTVKTDTATLSNIWLRRADSGTYYTKFRSDTSRSNIYTQIATKGTGTVTSIATGYGLSGGTITTSGTLIADTSVSGLSGKYIRIADTNNIRPRLIAGTNISITGTYPNQTIATTGVLTSSNFVDNETPSGTINGSNVTFTLANTPVTGSTHLYLNGVRIFLTTDYSVSGTTITMGTAPLTGSTLYIDYRK